MPVWCYYFKTTALISKKTAVILIYPYSGLALQSSERFQIAFGSHPECPYFERFCMWKLYVWFLQHKWFLAERLMHSHSLFS